MPTSRTRRTNSSRRNGRIGRTLGPAALAGRVSWGGWLVLVVALGLPGCSSGPEAASMVPDPASGRRAIEAVMAAWKAGRPPGVVEPTVPRVQAVDTHRKPGQRLDGFEILAESADARFRSYSVRLSLVEPEEHPVVRFLAVGIDPVLVFRQEDYDMLMHWEHRMDPEPDPTPK